jgi:hypothetical protein
MKKAVFVLMILALAICTLSVRHTSAQTFSITQTYCTGTAPCATTFHNDRQRDGANGNEPTFAAGTLGTTGHTPTPKWYETTDGEIYAHPLFVKSLTLSPGNTKDVVFVVTENNSVYQFNGSTGAQINEVSLNNASDMAPGTVEFAVPYTDIPEPVGGGYCNNITPEVGITGTPVIDTSITPPVLWVVSKHEDVNGSTSYRQKLHGLNAITLAEIPGSPLVLDTTWASDNSINFNPQTNNQRAGLALPVYPSQASGYANIVVAWASHCDSNQLPGYHGLAIDFLYDYNTPGFSLTYGIFDVESGYGSGDGQGGIWMSGSAPAIDADAHLFFSTGNGAYPSTGPGSGQYPLSFIRLKNNGTNAIDDYYTPPDYAALDGSSSRTVACAQPSPATCPTGCNSTADPPYCQIIFNSGGDWDLASGGVLMLDSTWHFSNDEVLAGGKQGMLYVVFAHAMGNIDAAASNPNKYPCTPGAFNILTGTIVQCFYGTVPSASDGSGLHGTPAFLAQGNTQDYNYLYVVGSGDYLRGWNLLSTGLFASTANIPNGSPHTFLYPGATPVVTWGGSAPNGVNDGVVWVLDTNSYGKTIDGQSPHSAGPAVLYAYSAIPDGSGYLDFLGDSSGDTGNPGDVGAVKFMSPLVVNGKIYMAGGAQGYDPTVSPCLAPDAAGDQPTACGGLSMFSY